MDDLMPSVSTTAALIRSSATRRPERIAAEGRAEPRRRGALWHHRGRRDRPGGAVPPITELTRIEPVYLERLEKQGIFTTGILLEVSETPARRQYLADHVDASPNDVLAWRDEALMLNLAALGADDHQLFIPAGVEALRDILALWRDAFGRRLAQPPRQLQPGPPCDLRTVGCREQARAREAE